MDLGCSATCRMSFTDLSISPASLQRAVYNLVWLCSNDVLKVNLDAPFVVYDTEDRLRPTMVDTVRYFAAKMLQTGTASPADSKEYVAMVCAE